MRGLRPSREDLERAAGGRIRDVLAPGLAVVFCGINPSLYSAAVGHHFARPGNRFWPALHGAGWTERQLAPQQDHLLLERGCGLTNLVARATASAAELTPDELAAGARRLRRAMARLRPRCVAFLGLGAFRTAFGAKRVEVGRQDLRLGDATVWALPNPSGLNAHYQLADFVRLFAELRKYGVCSENRRR
jgi:TDG/mug DNA glycosylase family protein